MTLRTHLAFSRGLLCLIALWVLTQCWLGVARWDGAPPAAPLTQGAAKQRQAFVLHASPAFGAASAPARRTTLASPGA